MAIRSRRLNMVAEVKNFGVEKCKERITFLTVILNPILYVKIRNSVRGISNTVQIRFLTIQDTLQFYSLHNSLN